MMNRDASTPPPEVSPAPGAGDADPIQGNRYPCRQCGARLEFKPGTASLVCPYCKYENSIEQSEAPIEELDFHETLRTLDEKSEHVEHAVVKCDACAAEVDLPPNIASLSCPYCTSNIVLQSTLRRTIKPLSLLPFRIDRKPAVDRVRAWIKSLWFAPTAIKRFADLDGSLKGVYYPAWTYDCDTTTRYTGMRGDAYYVTVSYTAMQNGKPVSRTRQERRIRWSPAAGTVGNTFDDLLVPASKSLPDAYVARLDPWDLESLTPYSDDYLSGFLAETYQIDLAQGFDVAKGMMLPTIDMTIRHDIGGDEQRITSRSITYDDITYKHILLPIWVGAYRFRDRVFRVLVNGRTGEVQGERPYSWIKITLAVLAAAAVIGAIVFISTRK
jgi:DNA-directed RNA polymerase subunit RPC12/RpoP